MTEYRTSPTLGDRYLVGDDGTIWSLYYRNTKNKQQIKCFDSGHGYIGLVVYLKGMIKPKRYQAHRIIAEAFIPNPDNLPHINHKNGIRNDNRVSNLEWVSVSDNLKYSYRVLGRKPIRICGELSVCSKLTSSDVAMIRKLYRSGMIPSKLADKFHINRSHIWRIINYISWNNKTESGTNI